MRELLLTLVLLFVFLFAPARLFQGLRGILLTYIFPDNKIFMDAVPASNPNMIMKAYEAKNAMSEFNPKQFANNRFLSRITYGSEMEHLPGRFWTD